MLNVVHSMSKIFCQIHLFQVRSNQIRKWILLCVLRCDQGIVEFFFRLWVQWVFCVSVGLFTYRSMEDAGLRCRLELISFELLIPQEKDIRVASDSIGL